MFSTQQYMTITGVLLCIIKIGITRYSLLKHFGKKWSYLLKSMGVLLCLDFLDDPSYPETQTLDLKDLVPISSRESSKISNTVNIAY